ncbi:MAG: hypothetical protein OJF52_000209 [Nitrospira sp.]|jgi:hypothetical protein|nr:MAG: hypothetical protein OJF52_000209 [Nitrospira sp.]
MSLIIGRRQTRSQDSSTYSQSHKKLTELKVTKSIAQAGVLTFGAVVIANFVNVVSVLRLAITDVVQLRSLGAAIELSAGDFLIEIVFGALVGLIVSRLQIANLSRYHLIESLLDTFFTKEFFQVDKQFFIHLAINIPTSILVAAQIHGFQHGSSIVAIANLSVNAPGLFGGGSGHGPIALFDFLAVIIVSVLVGSLIVASLQCAIVWGTIIGSSVRDATKNIVIESLAGDIPVEEGENRKQASVPSARRTLILQAFGRGLFSGALIGFLVGIIESFHSPQSAANFFFVFVLILFLLVMLRDPSDTLERFFIVLTWSFGITFYAWLFCILASKSFDWNVVFDIAAILWLIISFT